LIQGSAEVGKDPRESLLFTENKDSMWIRTPKILLTGVVALSIQYNELDRNAYKKLLFQLFLEPKIMSKFFHEF